jgi:predicted RNA-binding Zn ribbon-like protein
MIHSPASEHHHRLIRLLRVSPEINNLSIASAPVIVEVFGEHREMSRASNGSFPFVGRYRCLDFVNTALVAARGGTDQIQDFNGFVSWLHEAGLIDTAERRVALARWGKGREAQQTYGAALLFRLRMAEIAERLAARKQVSKTGLDAINEQLQGLAARAKVTRGKNGFVECLETDLTEPRQLIVRLAQSAADLLCHGDLSSVKRCANPSCSLYFYDTSKNHTRRWCSMERCGSRMKMAAYYQRRRLRREGP